MRNFTVFAFCIALSVSVFGQNVQKKSLCIGEVHQLKSAALDEERTLNIYLPLTYKADSAYPVMYILDGSMHEDFIHLVGLMQFFKLQFAMPDFIIVGIENVDRKRDFTFYTNIVQLQEKYPTTGHSDKFMAFLETELQPYIEKNFKTTHQKFIIGQSLGGLMATEILLKKPQLFTDYFIVSPSLWWDNESMLNDAENLIAAQKPTQNPINVFVAVGKNEPRIMKREAKKISKTLKVEKEKFNVNFLMMKGETHASILHQSINDMLKLMYEQPQN